MSSARSCPGLVAEVHPPLLDQRRGLGAAVERLAPEDLAVAGANRERLARREADAVEDALEVGRRRSVQGCELLLPDHLPGLRGQADVDAVVVDEVEAAVDDDRRELDQLVALPLPDLPEGRPNPRRVEELAASDVVAVARPVDGLGRLRLLLLAGALLASEGGVGVGNVVGTLEQRERGRDDGRGESKRRRTRDGPLGTGHLPPNGQDPLHRRTQHPTEAGPRQRASSPHIAPAWAGGSAWLGLGLAEHPPIRPDLKGFGQRDSLAAQTISSYLGNARSSTSLPPNASKRVSCPAPS